MSDLAAQQTRIAPMTGAHGAGAEQPYPRYLVVLSVLAFCLSCWAVVVFAVVHYG